MIYPLRKAWADRDGGMTRTDAAGLRFWSALSACPLGA